MHFNVYVDDETGHQLKDLAEKRGQTRNALIREALREWTQVHVENAGWPSKVLAFEGMSEMEAFESHRAALLPPKVDPLT